MYAVVETGGKQYRVASGDVVDIELLSAKAGDAVEFDRVLLVGDESASRVGAPLVEGAIVHGRVLGAVRGEKIRVFKMKKRKGYRRTRGHRQNLQRVQIESVQA